jgi:hypothetical protein
MQLVWGRIAGISLHEIGIHERIQDVTRAKRYSDNLALLVREEAGELGAIKAIDNRIATIAITENADAFNGQRKLIADSIAERLDLVEVWDAMNDKVTCDACWSMNGQRAVVGVGFAGGLRPGRVHARCRCTSHFEPLVYH